MNDVSHRTTQVGGSIMVGERSNVVGIYDLDNTIFFLENQTTSDSMSVILDNKYRYSFNLHGQYAALNYAKDTCLKMYEEGGYEPQVMNVNRIQL